MKRIIQGKVYIFGENIDTDRIYPGKYLELTEYAEISKHCMEGEDSDFSKKFEKGGIIVAGRNFGCGSSREHAVIALKALGVSAVIAPSFSRIFYRNSINLGLPAIMHADIAEFASNGDEIRIDFRTGEMVNLTQKKCTRCEPLSDYIMEIMMSGGIKDRIIQGR